MESVFGEPSVPCTHSGASVLPIGDILTPIALGGHLELHAKVLSYTQASPLWLGSALCGKAAGVRSVLDSCMWRSAHTLDTAAWTGIAASFMRLPGGERPGGDEISRAAIWRLRHDCHGSYPEEEAFQYSGAPINGWEPCGVMAVKDIEIDLQDHLYCRHIWEYCHWTWLDLDSPTDEDFRLDKAIAHWPAVPGADEDELARRAAEAGVTRITRVMIVSKVATERTFNWCGDQIEEGVTGRFVPFRHVTDAPLLSRDSEPCTSDGDKIHAWLGEIKMPRRDKSRLPLR